MSVVLLPHAQCPELLYDYIHRDFKASNVLLKITCNCPNPLVCTCRDKYSVVVADFDASVQLDDLNQLPPTTLLTTRNGQEACCSIYQCIPVGTRGFRAPECAFEIISNSPDAYSPPISCRSDMFSFGVFCLRFFTREDSPKTQKTLAMMMLNYYQEKGLVEGRPLGLLEVTSKRVEEMLKV